MKYRITLGPLCFGIEARYTRNVSHVAPVAKWAIGKNIDVVINYYLVRGAIVEKLD